MKFSIFNFQFLIFILIFVSSLLVVPNIYAQIFTNNLGGAPGSEFTTQNLFGILNGLACWIIRFAMIAVAVAFILAGILFLTGRGNPQGMSKAKKALTWSIVGTAVIMGVFTIILTVAYFVGAEYPIASFISC